MAKILVINGPNLNLLGSREPAHYGSATLEQINAGLQDIATSAGHAVEALQSNAEHELVNRVQQAEHDGTAFIVVNPAAFTHSSIALRDALSATRIPFIEVHLSNIHAREEFRRRSYFSDIAAGVISGLGPVGYELALRAAIAHLKQQPS
jgi:3-dehydroquinate dehydratase-2